MANATLISGGHVYAPEDLGVTDILIKDSRIAALGELAGTEAGTVIDATGKLVFPGVIETHAHMLLPLAEAVTQNDFYTGTVSGAFGGVTTLIDFADQTKGNPALQAVESRLKQAESSIVDYGFHCTFTDITPATLDEMQAVVERGISSFKFYTTYKSDGLYVDDGSMLAAFERARELGALVTVHAENDDIIARATASLKAQGKTAPRYFPLSKPEISEQEAITRMILLAEQAGVQLLVRHVTSKSGIEAVAAAQERGLPVYAETTPTYLLLTREVYGSPAEFIVHPPIRGEKDKEALWQAVLDGTVDVIATDDCAFTRAQKRKAENFWQVPGGLPGIETRLPLMYQEGVVKRGLGMEQLVRILSTNPAAVYSLEQKGALRPGMDADIVVYDPEKRWTVTADALHEQTDWSPFAGMQIKGRVDKTLVRGGIVIDGDRCLAAAGNGQYLHRKPGV